ncbi:MAG: hypothetical protein ACI8V2_004921, partial [Candidatus Latescibacterota bacterium]
LKRVAINGHAGKARVAKKIWQCKESSVRQNIP